jgi:capsular polysaccharide biosynthesis protein
MSIVTTGPGARGQAAGTPEETSAGGGAPPYPPAPERSRKGAPAAPPAAPRDAEPHPNGRGPAGAAAQPDEVTVVVRPRSRRRLRALRWPALIVLALLLVGAGGWAGLQAADRMPTLYAAHADVVYPLVQEQPTGFLRQDRNLSTQEVLITGRSVLDPVAVQFGMAVDDMQDHLSTEVVEESEVIRLQFTDPSRAQARKVLVAIVARYLEISNNPARTEVRAYLDAQLTDVRARLVTARAEADDVGALGLSQAAQAQVNALVTREAALLAQIDAEQFAAIAGPAPQVSVQPYVEHDAVSPKPLLVMGGGALAGLVVALIVVAVLARRMSRR